MARKVKAALVSSTDGNDWIEGGSGDDFMVGGLGSDTFVLRANSGHDTVQDFSVADGDVIMFDSQTGVYDGLLDPFGSPSGFLFDGMSFSNSHNTASWVVHAGDYNNDGLIDTRIDMLVGGHIASTIDLLGVSPGAIPAYDLLGG